MVHWKIYVQYVQYETGNLWEYIYLRNNIGNNDESNPTPIKNQKYTILSKKPF